ncbi:MAG: sodium:solute symporter family protein [Myxococcales bacterium]|nr:sodium:solute symporter family protein [Myxococcales bacterium]
MSFGTFGVAALCVYLGSLVVVAVVARRSRRDLSPADHFLAGRDLGVFVLFLTLYATAYSGNSLLGYPGEAYRRGFSWVMATGFMMSIIVVFHALVPRLRPIAVSFEFVTPGDWVRHRFGAEPRGGALVLAVALLMTIALANFLFAQLKAMGMMAEQVTGGLVPYEFGVVVLAGMVLFYETLGGMRAVAWTDAVQGVLMMLGLAILLTWLLGESAGLGAMTGAIREVRPEAVAVPEARECANWASTIVLLGLASVVYPQAIQRVYAAGSARTLRQSLALMTFMPLVTTLVVTLIGLAAIPRFRDLGAVEADRVMPLLLGEWAATGPLFALAAVLVFIGALAAIMSTADSVLLSLGSQLAEDVLGRSHRDDATTQLGKRIAAGVMIAMALLAMVARDVTLWGLIELKMELLIQCVPAFLIGLHWRGLRAGPALVGLLAGAALAIAGVFLDVMRVGGVHVGVIGLGVNVAIAGIGSLWAAPRLAQGQPGTSPRSAHSS